MLINPQNFCLLKYKINLGTDLQAQMKKMKWEYASTKQTQYPVIVTFQDTINQLKLSKFTIKQLQK